LNQSGQEKTEIKEFKIFKIIDSKTLNQLMKLETISNSTPVAPVPITNRFKTTFEEILKTMKIKIQATPIAKASVKTKVVALTEMKIFFVLS
jgi:hypothetical protein